MAGGRGAAGSRGLTRLSLPPAAPGGAAAADPGVGAGPGPAVDLATAAPSLGLALARDRGPRPSPDRREDPSPSHRPCPDLARGPGPGPGPGVPRPCPRGSPSPGRGPRAPPSLLKRREPCPLRQTVMPAGPRRTARLGGGSCGGVCRKDVCEQVVMAVSETV